jgi:hypothetical protein
MLDHFAIKMNFANPQKHIPEAEQNHWVIKEQVQAMYHCLLFKQLTKSMTTWQKISLYYSPRMILHQKNLDYLKNCKTTFRSFVQAYNKPNPKNDNSPRTLDCIYLRYTDSHQGGHELLHLPTNQVIARRNITMILITKAIQDQVAELAKAEEMPEGLKISSKTDVILYNLTWIAGVDHTPEHEEEN